MQQTFILSEKSIKHVLDNVESQFVRAELLSLHTLALHQKTKLAIYLPTEEVQKKHSAYELIKGKACLDAGHSRYGGRLEVDCFVAYGYWQRLASFGKSSINLVDHLDQLVPRVSGRNIGLFTCQNGIQNDLDDFEMMCKSIIAKLSPENPLFIGLYNPTSGKGVHIIDDLKRLTNEWVLNVETILFLRQMFSTFANRLKQINPSFLWTHIAHSEGGLVAEHCLSDSQWAVSPLERAYLQKGLMTLVYGGVSPISDAYVYDKVNTYSNKDIALNLVKKHLDKVPMPDLTYQDRMLLEAAKEQEKIGFVKNAEELVEQLKAGRNAYHYINKYPHVSEKNGYTITVVDCITKNPPSLEGDHGFLGDTYQDQLKENIKNFRRRWGIYDAKTGF